MTNTFEPNALYPFDKITIKIPKALQGGTYNAKLEINDEPIIIQTPKPPKTKTIIRIKTMKRKGVTM